jgi:DNA-binding transcriptional LysR family regulator
VQVEAGAIVAALTDGQVDAALARLPVDKQVFHAIALYDELPVVVVPQDHMLAALGEDETVEADDLADDVVNVPADDVLFDGQPPVIGQRPVAYADDGTIDPDGDPARAATTEEVISWVANGAGVTIMPMSLARLHRRKDVTYRLLADGPVSSVGLVWLRDNDSPLVEEMVGIVRGRTANSSRGRGAPAPDGSATTTPPTTRKKAESGKAPAKAGKRKGGTRHTGAGKPARGSQKPGRGTSRGRKRS